MKVFLICLLFVGISAVDYCSLCSNHIACGNSGNFAATCPADKKLVTLTSSDIQAFVTEHNILRNKIASGGQPGFSTASRMTTMVWSAELAQLAALNVKQCKMAHDKCRATADFRYAGQNLYAGWTTGTPDSPSVAIPKVVQRWYSEVQDATQTDLNQCCNSASGKTIGHFTVMVADRSTHVGCAMATYTDSGKKTTLVACNYAFTNLIGAKVYQTGGVASKCTTGVNPSYRALCSVNEPVKAI